MAYEIVKPYLEIEESPTRRRKISNFEFNSSLNLNKFTEHVENKFKIIRNWYVQYTGTVC